MANSKYEYVKSFERADPLLPNTWIVVRIDGRGFHKLSAKYGFEKPNDRRALDLMNAAAIALMKEVPDIVLGYGISDEFSKITTTIAATFTSYYVHLWSSYFPDKALSPPLPSFDGRAVQYPSVQNLRDYLCWRQVDCHINNLYNTTFWALVQQGGIDPMVAEGELKGTMASDKNEILFSRFKINYNNEADMFRKGSTIYRDLDGQHAGKHPSNDEDDSRFQGRELSKSQRVKEQKRRVKANFAVKHLDIISDDFWDDRPWLLSETLAKRSKDP
ncbi:tRNA-His guanylyltransferase [Hypocenomyce scalaris]|nr:tRNA-His guanylyltransferase [Hypocenomyce scalaris]